MKVVIVSDYSVNPYGGLQTHVYHLTSQLSLFEDLEIHIITLGDTNRDFKINNLNIHVLKRQFNIPRIFTIPFDARLVKKKLSEINPDIVHVQGTHYPYNLIAGQISSDYSTILTVHGLMAREYKFNRGLNYLGGYLSFILEKYAFKKVKDIIVCSEPMQRDVEKLSGADIYLIPNGIELDKITSYKQLKSVKHPSIMYMGLLENIKGVDILIKALKLVKDKIPDIHLYIAGEGSQEHFLKQLVENLKLDGNVDFLGYLTGEDKYAYLKSVDICVVPSLYESFGIIILESMACGTPVIASNSGNIPYLLKNDLLGIKFKYNSSEELAEKIIYLIKNPDLRLQMCKESLKLTEKFKWSKIAERTAKLYGDILN
jgi:glycosyltransferase involved in cell wall biosynthesis